ncbi:MAG TPA: tetratricopeptide repeat protein, partial [Planctomycetaceae bacterium]|nr:tetratricopeptide repeat protein [Planctomycetaceae bacterium]
MASDVVRQRRKIRFTTAEDARRFAARLMEQVPDSERFDAQQVLRDYPELADHDEAVLDLAYEDVCRRLEAGEAVDVRAFAARFPTVRDSLLRALEIPAQFLPPSAAKERITHLLWPAPGDEFLQFHLQEELGRGAFSRVFLAAEPRLGNRRVVVKLCPRGLGDREAQALGQLEHPHVMPVYSVRTDVVTDLTAICMPFLGRATLADVLRELPPGRRPPLDGELIDRVVENLNRRNADAPPLTAPSDQPRRWTRWAFRLRMRESYVEAIVRIGAQLAAALVYTHSRGLLHADIKPSNVLLRSGGQALLFDFNLSLSKWLSEIGIGGTLEYMPPEQLRAIAHKQDRAQLDARSDLFSLAATLYQSLSGRLPFGPAPENGKPAEQARQLLRRQQRPPDPLNELNPDVPAGLARVIHQCLAFEPAQRLRTAAELQDVLRSFNRATARALRRIRPRRRTTVAAACSLMALGIAAGVIASRRSIPSTNRLRKGWAAYELGNHVVASRLFDAAWRSGESIRDGRALAWLAYYNCRNRPEPATFRQAIEQNQLAIHQGLVTAAVFNNLGYCYLQLGDLAKAQKALEQGLALSPTAGALHRNLLKVELAHARRTKRPPAKGVLVETRRHSPLTADLAWDAALFGALTAAYCDDDILRDKSIRLTYSNCLQALAQGIEPRRVDELLKQFPILKRDRRFHGLTGSSSDA